ncbi:hypothetical protein BCR39DRAFT_559141 [Naematelia encephala]|uniref:Uncharacterized protein n=1 Tax=Naematelia encephala TaxID=71784 RepID=A0A1Y2B5F6_9TREE|nr:hypothetical protein BCR39DRAFT_559141 [Naematelia encephala]
MTSIVGTSSTRAGTSNPPPRPRSLFSRFFRRASDPDPSCNTNSGSSTLPHDTNTVTSNQGTSNPSGTPNPPSPSHASRTTNTGTSNPAGRSSFRNWFSLRPSNPPDNTDPDASEPPPVTNLRRPGPYTVFSLRRAFAGYTPTIQATVQDWMGDAMNAARRHRRPLTMAAVALCLLTAASVPESVLLEGARNTVQETENILMETMTALGDCRSNLSLAVPEEDITSAMTKVVQAAGDSNPSIADAMEQICDFTDLLNGLGGVNLTETEEKVVTAFCFVVGHLPHTRRDPDSTSDSVDLENSTVDLGNSNVNQEDSTVDGQGTDEGSNPMSDEA